jgi:hypothetical protein
VREKKLWREEEKKEGSSVAVCTMIEKFNIYDVVMNTTAGWGGGSKGILVVTKLLTPFRLYER